MQNQTLPIQLSPTALAPAPARVTTQANSDSAVFSQTLNREMQQRQDAPKPEEAAPQPAAQPQPQPKQAQAQPAKPATSQAPAQQAATTEDAPATDDTAAADTTAGSATADTTADTTAAATTTTKAADTTDDTATAAAAGAAVAAPMADMLAMLASYKALTQAATPKADAAATAAATDALKSKGGTTIATDTQTLATLQNALKKGDTATDDDATGGPVRASLHMPAESAAAGTKKTDPNDPAATTAATTRTTPDVAATAAKAAPQSEAALATLRDAAVAAVSKDTAPVTGSAFQAQLTSAATTQAAVTPSSDVIPARLGTTAWDNQVSQKVVWMVGGADQTASLTLNPPDLGPVQVVLNVNNDQATVAFSSATPEVREALENAMPRLREMLSDAGVTLSQSSVNANMPDGRQADTSQNQGNGNRGGGNGRNVRSGETEIALPASVSRVVRDNSNVDTFA